jgi:predicted dehydrogenase
MVLAEGRIPIAVIGTGDVAQRSYFPALASVQHLVQVVAVSDLDEARARRGADTCASWSSGVATYSDYRRLLAHPGLEAVVNLTPAPQHSEVNSAALASGLHVLSEKPIATTVEDTDRLIAEAEKRAKLFLVAPGIAATPLVRWLRQLVASGHLGHPTVATGRFGGLGPAAWRDYSGDPAVFYSEAVGPMVDQGVYLVHALTALLGPVRRVQALGGITIPERLSVSKNAMGERVQVRSADVLLVNLAFEGGAFAQVFSSFAAPASACPTLELHFTEGSVSVRDIVSAVAPVDLYERGPGALAVEGWRRGLVPPGTDAGVGTVGRAAVHFVRCLAGLDEPVLTAKHSRHVFEVMAAAKALAGTGDSALITSSF